MRYILTSVVMTAGIVFIALEASRPDGYYVSGVTHWEHASNAGSAPVVVGGIVVASGIALIFLLNGLRARRLGAPAVVCGTTIYLLAWVVAWIALMGGH